MKRLIIVFLCALESLIFAQTAPSLVNYQGKLTDQSGASLSAGTYVLQFRIWDSATSTSSADLVWAQQQTVTVQPNGIFNCILGSPGGVSVAGATPQTSNLSLAFTQTNRFIGITVVTSNGVSISAAAEIIPRQQFLSVPYAFQAATAQTVLTSPIPHGVITLWSGSIATVPSGWVLCDGNNGAPDLRNRFVVGADADSGGVAQTSYTGSPTQTGGNVHHTHSGKTGFTADWTYPTYNNIDRYPNSWDRNPNIDHDHPFTTGNESVVPVVYFALAYIMKL